MRYWKHCPLFDTNYANLALYRSCALNSVATNTTAFASSSLTNCRTNLLQAMASSEPILLQAIFADSSIVQCIASFVVTPSNMSSIATLSTAFRNATASCYVWEGSHVNALGCRCVPPCVRNFLHQWRLSRTLALHSFQDGCINYMIGCPPDRRLHWEWMTGMDMEGDETGTKV